MTIPTKSEEALDIMNKVYYPETWTGGLHRVLCMQGGDDDGSYAKNSEAPASAITLCKPMLLTAIQSMKLFFNNNEEGGDDSLRIADLGCATGYNTLATIDMVVESLRRRYVEECSCFEPEFEVFFSDLPSNDFNSLFKSLSGNKSRNYYAAGVPGSFYRRLFAKRKLHIAVSLSALHWLSQIPDAVVDKASPAWNKGRAWIDGAKKEVVEAYAKQSEKDMEDFLRCRKEEMVQGGILFMLMGGRPGSQLPENQLGDPDSRAKHPFTNSMDQAWQDLLNEGLIDEETRDGFNIPAYMRSMEEVENAIRKCGGFEIQRMEYKKIVEHSEDKQQEWIKDPVSYGRAKANLVRATLRPIVEALLGPYLSYQLFKRFENRVSSDFTLLHKTLFYGVIVVCAIRI
ncbi:gibberellic acid methyltransferase 2 [Tripterygium wilfordii]|uniref:Gibberellic acid methyltransferase 2 n=1 Tax=Tripterygium wilfordii TaxID=458696 RepID=A0A7J7CNL1_TRIWF|nr:gibberellic acid methyltransferase 2-like [Tripterygium wilfordii]KAF5735675.1 gibberellic acid methyltransferase 2 [Tripterygium wilfordii]